MGQSYITVEIPKNLLTPGHDLGDRISDELQALPTSERHYTQNELLSLKSSIPRDIERVKRRILKSKETDLSVIQAALINIKAMEFNLSVVKCSIALANTALNPTIIGKGSNESTKVFLSRVLNENLKVRTNNYSEEWVSNEIEEVKKEAGVCAKTLEKYNSLMKAKIKLFDI